MDVRETKATEKTDLKETLEKQLYILHERSVKGAMSYMELAEISRAMCAIVETINRHYPLGS